MILALAALFFSATVAVAGPRPAPPPADLGSFRLGMRYEDARAAAPRAAWSQKLSTHTGKPVAFEGQGAMRVNGRPFDVTLTPLAYGAYLIDAVHAEQRNGLRAESCKATLSALATEIEARFGPLGSVTPISAQEAGAMPVGMETALDSWPMKPQQMGVASHVDAFERDNGSAIWLTGRRGEGLTVLVGARYLGGDSLIWPFTCVIFARIASMPPRPAFELLDPAKLPALPRPTAAARHHSFDDLPALPGAAASVPITCNIDRGSGRFSDCKADDGVPAALARPAERQGGGLAGDPTLLDPDNDVPLRVKLVIQVDPADRRPMGPPTGAPVLQLTQVTWAHQVTGDDLTRYYPARALEQGIGARVVALCEIQADGLLICPQIRAEPASVAGMGFERAGQVAERRFRAAPTLPDGSAAVGRWVRLAFNFRIG